MTQRVYDFSHTKIDTYETCPRKFLHKYLRKYYPKKRPVYFAIGSAFHAFQDKFYDMRGEHLEVALRAADQVMESVDMSLMTPEEIADYQIDRAMVQGMCVGYSTYYKGDFDEFPTMLLEQECTRDNGIVLVDYRDEYKGVYTGKIDGLFCDAAGDWWVLETKTTGSVPKKAYFDKIHIDSQTLGYLHLANKVLGKWPRGVLYNVIKKTQIRKKGGETLEAFTERVKLEYVNNNEEKQYFIRYPLEVSKHHLDDWLKEKGSTVSRILTCVEIKSKTAWTKYTNSCLGMYGSGCEYLSACKDGNYNVLLYEKGKK